MKWFWILGVLLGAGGPVRAQMDSVVICLEKIKTATEDSVRLEYAGEIEFLQRIQHARKKIFNLFNDN